MAIKFVSNYRKFEVWMRLSKRTKLQNVGNGLMQFVNLRLIVAMSLNQLGIIFKIPINRVGSKPKSDLKQLLKLTSVL